MELFDAREKQWNKDNPGKNFYNEALRVINISKDEMQGDPLLEISKIKSKTIDDPILNQYGANKINEFLDRMEEVIRNNYPNILETNEVKTWLLGQGINKDVIEWSTMNDYLDIQHEIVTDYQLLVSIDKDRQRIMNLTDINSPEFRTWFEGSKVVKADGKPKIVYHGDVDKNIFLGNVFSSDKYNIASQYGNKLHEVYLSIKNPLVINAKNRNWADLPVPKKHKDVIKTYYNSISIDNLADYAKQLGYDGLIVNNVRDQYGVGTQYVTFDPTQIKSVNNTGSWDPNNPNMLFQLGEPILETDINTPAFRKAFANTKVADERGNPIPVYHRSKNQFEEFDYSKINTHFNGYGFYFDTEETGSQAYGDIVYKSFVNLENPLIRDASNPDVKVLTIDDTRNFLAEIDNRDNAKYSDHRTLDKLRESIVENDRFTHKYEPELLDVNAISDIVWNNASRDNDIVDYIIEVSGDDAKSGLDALRAATGYDGFIVKYGPKSWEVVAWFPEQIKSVYNRGTWDTTNPNMLYQSLNERIKGEFNVVDGDTAIHFLESKDVTTLVHESGHLFRRTLNDKQMGDFAQWAGFKSADEYLDYDNRFWDGKLTEEESKRYSEAEEKFARGWEQYLTEGKAPTPTLARVFKAFTEWMLDN